MISGDVGYRKPSREIYEIALQKAGVKPENCIFIDDRDKNLLPAMELGMNVIKFSREESSTSLDGVQVISRFEDLENAIGRIWCSQHMNNMDIKRGTYEDFWNYWRDADWARPQFGEYMKKDDAEFWYAILDGIVVGRIYFFKNLSDKDGADGTKRGYICNLHVLREYRKQGIGTALINTIKERGREIGFSHITLGVDEDELANVRLYKNLGFTKNVKKCNRDFICTDENGKFLEGSEFLLMECLL